MGAREPTARQAGLWPGLIVVAALAYPERDEACHHGYEKDLAEQGFEGSEGLWQPDRWRKVAEAERGQGDEAEVEDSSVLPSAQQLGDLAREKVLPGPRQHHLRAEARRV